MGKNLKLSGDNRAILERLEKIMSIKPNISFGKLIDGIFCPENICLELLTSSNTEVIDRMDNMIEQYETITYKIQDPLSEHPEDI